MACRESLSSSRPLPCTSGQSSLGQGSDWALQGLCPEFNEEQQGHGAVMGAVWLKGQRACPSGTIFLKATYHTGLWITEKEGQGYS